MNPTAIVIEDDEDLSTIFTEAMRAAGFHVETVPDGALARERLAGKIPNVIILDLHLPKVSGEDLFTEIKGNQRFAGTKVVIATADVRMGEKFRRAANFVLIKPISFIQLRELSGRLRAA